MDCTTPGSLVRHYSWSLLKSMSIESVMPSNHPILCRPLLLLPSIFPSTRVFSNESALRIKCPKYWSFSFSIQWIFKVDLIWNWLGWSPCSPRDSQESFPAPHFKSINQSIKTCIIGVIFLQVPQKLTFFVKVQRSTFRVKCPGHTELEFPTSKLSSH